MSIESTYVVTLNWNGKDDTLACLASLEEMEPQASQIILVDNASSDGTCEAVAERFPRVQVLVNNENLGFARGINVGLRAALDAGASHILMVNNDTLVPPDLLGVLVEAVDKDETIGAAAPKITYADPPDLIWYAGAFRRRWLPGFSFPGYGKKDAARYNLPRDVDYFTGCGVLVRGKVLDQIGLFDEKSFFMYHEDLDLSERIRRSGYRIVYAPQTRMWHKESASTAPLSPQKWYYLARYVVPFYRRYYRWPGPSVAAYALYVVLRELAKGHPQIVAPFLRGIRDGLRESGHNQPPS